MWDVLSALTPPAVVGAVFCWGVYKLVRAEMVPRTTDGRAVDLRDGSAGGAKGRAPGAAGPARSDRAGTDTSA
ncbi:hypothetical protein CLV72_103411 [Allonocardiopsis opalescens]|uniref:Uncharacterized protein n=1 Tax=Allonocardiopsis opalescens TaxID=1144618 RepID=A0A2T0Q7M8_9ACTN|nr:hypothetical protein CLV72_103411 [Allonocardiopsis opalescens]